MWSTKREKGDPSFFSVLPCSWQSRALVNSKGKGRAEWSWRSGARSCRELPAPLYLPWRKEWPAAASQPFSPGFNRRLVKRAQAGYLNTKREKDREWGMEVREVWKEMKGGVGEARGYRVCISSSLCPHCVQNSWSWSVTERKSNLV